MNEYEVATLASRTLGHWIVGGQLLVALVIGLGQIAVVWFGIQVMRQAGERRAKEQDQHHDEAMTALRELIARTGRAEPTPGASA